MDVLSSGESEPIRDRAQTHARPEELHATNDDLTAFETFDLPDDGEVDVEDAFGDHDIEYWVWDGNRLIPAPPMKLARIRELEALDRLAWLQQLDARAQGSPNQDSLAIPIPVRLFAAVRHGIAAFAARLRGLLRHTHADGASRHESRQHEPERSLTYEHRPPG